MKKFLPALYIQLVVSAFLVIAGCSKTAENNSDPCASKNIVILTTTVNTSSAAAEDGSATVLASGSNGFTYSLDNGVYQSSPVFSDLPAGTYMLNVRDVDGCTKTASFNISSNVCPAITVSATITPATNATTADGAINAVATGSTGIMYSLDGVTFQASGSFTSLLPGMYSVIAKDINNCQGINYFVVNSTSCSLTITATTTPPSGAGMSDGSVLIHVTGGTAPYVYALDGIPYQSSNVFTNLASGTHTVAVADAAGCVDFIAFSL